MCPGGADGHDQGAVGSAHRETGMKILSVSKTFTFLSETGSARQFQRNNSGHAIIQSHDFRKLQENENQDLVRR